VVAKAVRGQHVEPKSAAGSRHTKWAWLAPCWVFPALEQQAMTSNPVTRLETNAALKEATLLIQRLG
jgi:hypothetical protein